MAFSTSIQKGQFPKVCELCETDNKINWKCVNCNLLMCTRCKDKVHSKFQSADKHKIIDIKEVGTYSQELDFSNINCDDHEGQTCVMFCKSCEQLVCPQCIADVHDGHGLVQIREGYNIQIKYVKEIQQQIISHIEELSNGESKIKLFRQDENSKYTETRNLIQAQNAALKQEVDKYAEKLTKELEQKWEALEKSMDEEEQKVRDMKMGKEDQNIIIDCIVNSKDAYQVFKESKHMGKLLKESMEPVMLDFITMPKFLPGEITENNFGSLQEVPDLIMNIHQQFTTDIDGVSYLSSCPDNSLWINNENTLKRVKPEGSNLKVISNFNIKIYDMALTPSNDLLMVAEGSRLKQISGSSGEITDSVYSVDPLYVSRVHVTSDYKVIVGVFGSGRKMIIKMNKEGKHEKTYEHDRHKQPIFTQIQNITTTTNGTIFVVDRLPEDDTRRVVVLGQDGDVINTYTGHPKINSDDKSFQPVRVVTTPLDNIIVTTVNNNYLHILNTVGRLLTYYNTEDIGIQLIWSLSFSSSGQLYIGCLTLKDSKEKAKLYKVDISPI